MREQRNVDFIYTLNLHWDKTNFSFARFVCTFSHSLFVCANWNRICDTSFILIWNKIVNANVWMSLLTEKKKDELLMQVPSYLFFYYNFHCSHWTLRHLIDSLMETLHLSYIHFPQTHSYKSIIALLLYHSFLSCNTVTISFFIRANFFHFAFLSNIYKFYNTLLFPNSDPIK